MGKILRNFFGVDKNNGNLKITILGIKIKFTKKGIKGDNNKLFIRQNGVLKEFKGKIEGLSIHGTGNNNKIIIGKPYKFIDSGIVCNGDNNTIIIEETNGSINCQVVLRHHMSNRKVHIKKNAYINGASLYAWTNNSSITIGENCLFSWGINIMTGDAHRIMKQGSTEIINNGSFCEIGNHVWIAQGCCICKDVKIPDNSVIGAQSVVTKSFDKSNIIIAGNPAKIIKTNIDWDKDINF